MKLETHIGATITAVGIGEKSLRGRQLRADLDELFTQVGSFCSVKAGRSVGEESKPVGHVRNRLARVHGALR